MASSGKMQVVENLYVEQQVTNKILERIANALEQIVEQGKPPTVRITPDIDPGIYVPPIQPPVQTDWKLPPITSGTYTVPKDPGRQYSINSSTGYDHSYDSNVPVPRALREGYANPDDDFWPYGEDYVD